MPAPSFKQRWELVQSTLAASSSSSGATSSSSSSSSSSRFPSIGLAHHQDPHSKRRYQAVDLDAMAQLSRQTARASSKPAKRAPAAPPPPRAVQVQDDRQPGEASSSKQVEEQAAGSSARREEQAPSSRSQYEAVRKELKTLDFSDPRYLEPGRATDDIDRLLGSLTIAPLEAMRADGDVADAAWEEPIREAVDRIWVSGTTAADRRARCEEARELLGELIAESLRRESDTAYRGREVRRAVVNAGLRHMLE
ncbi:uncharacterized protein RHOBADRAFT_56433 [Rhodotorula graminis WP1]|uniref:Uncharacterized protein n=1 Tax=Rhodotorula graminis (strain WP1) TaxID=578459 RepID=A0A0P9EXE8_RHOGW|nr:uncharacterized protein RHOBADRAFT_56433 [Rhodotorula graminis WP1]KPV71823.1 hypothetical protein RHOBADRAFT_56433 [Rhodotorula graminis WP1]